MQASLYSREIDEVAIGDNANLDFGNRVRSALRLPPPTSPVSLPANSDESDNEDL